MSSPSCVSLIDGSQSRFSGAQLIDAFEIMTRHRVGFAEVLDVLAEPREHRRMPSAAVARVAAIISSKDSPGMNFETARRMNGTRVPFSRSHWLSDTLRSNVRATLMRLSSYPLRAGASVCSGPMRASCGQTARTINTTISVANPPPTTDRVGPNIAAVAPLSNAPNSFEKPMKT